ncbi:cytochrome P450 [Aspergillus arachidicola]|uniref:Cytochrome P450 n=1 Tax=Aspergillus arachidicola TaxID=656916 RepID=A0A5N6XU55_9EURO|nr:cytochrome P450 [Aspergillus arachidicola]
MALGLEIPNISFLIAIARPLSRTPPILSLTRDERTNNLLESLERQIQQHGPVIGLRRDGRVEYIVFDELTPQVLTDDAKFSFELGTAKILKIEFLPSMFGNSIFQDIDSVINTLLTKHFDRMTHRGVAELIGTFRSRSLLARYVLAVWQIVTWLKVVIYTVMIRFGIAFGPLIWNQISVVLLKSNGKPSKDDGSLVRILVETSGATNGRIGFKSRLWIFVLVVVFIFASVHKTVLITMWTMFQLALHPEYQDIIRHEIHDLTCRDSSPVSNRSPRYNDGDPKTVDGMRWVEKQKAASTTDLGHLSFWLGRWACPGRFLAIAEIKLAVFALLADTRLELVSGRYNVADGFNITGNPHGGELVFKRIGAC